MAMGLRVLYVTVGGEETASTRYRVCNILPHLEDAGIQCETLIPLTVRERIPGPDIISDGLSLVLIFLRAFQYDVVYLQKVRVPPLFVKALSLITEVVFDFDDALYAAPPWENDEGSEPAWLPGCLRNVDQVVVGGPELAEYAEQYHHNVQILPTPLPRDRYARDSADVSDSNVVIGWIGNPENLWYLQNQEESISRVLRRHEDIELHIVTSQNREFSPFSEFSESKVMYHEWSRDAELDYLKEFDVAIRPLYDDEWSRAKGGFTSVVQCMALGIPVVVTPVGILDSLVEPGVEGFHATSAEDWELALEEILEDPEMRVEMGAAARQKIEDSWLWADEYADRLAAYFSGSGRRY